MSQEKHSDNKSPHQIVKVIAKCSIALFAIVLFGIIGVPYFFSDRLTQTVKEIANEQLQVPLDFQRVNIGFWKHFPALTISLEEVHLKGSNPLDTLPLLTAKGIGLGIDLSSLMSDQLKITTFYLDQASIHLATDTAGTTNYNVLKPSTDSSTSSDAESETALQIERIILTRTNVQYSDAGIPLSIQLEDLNYEGTGKLANTIFDLHSKASAQTFSFSYNNVTYVNAPNLAVHLQTRIGTNGPDLHFTNSTIRLNEVPLHLSGYFNLLPDGHNAALHIATQHTPLANLLQLTPPAYKDWLVQTSFGGETSLTVSYTGTASKNSSPDLAVSMAIKEGKIAHQNVTTPLHDLFLSTHICLPELNINKVHAHTDTLHFLLGNGYFQANAETKGIQFPLWFKSTFKGKLDLQELDQAVGLPNMTLKGLLNVAFNGEGTYDMAIRKKGLRETWETYISSVPRFQLSSQVDQGYFKLDSLPQGIADISFQLNTSNKTGQFKHTQIYLNNLKARALENFIEGNVQVSNLETLPIKAALKARLKLEEITLFMPLDSVEVKGNLAVNFTADGTYEPSKRLFPKTHSDINLTNGYFKSLAYPLPIEDISVQTLVQSARGSYKDLTIKILPIRFKIADEPFMLNADLKDFDNLNYQIYSKGSLDLGQIYKIFAIDGYDIQGKIRSNFSLKGLQKDAEAGDFEKLVNRGRLSIENVIMQSELFPKPYQIKEGHFKFSQEKMIFEKFTGNYGNNKFQLDGYLTNVLPYMFNEKSNVTGSLVLVSPKFNVNDFMFDAPTTAPASSTNTSGVVMLPAQTAVAFQAKIDEVLFNDFQLKNFMGTVITNDKSIKLDSTQFEIAGAIVGLNADYTPLSPNRALFSSHIKATDFDVEKAYQDIPLFREMATSAKDMAGKVSLDYALTGKLDANMEPVLKSIEGNGTLTLEDIQFKNFRLLGAISKNTNKKDLSNERVSKVVIKSHIKDNVMTIERTKMRMAGFRPRFEGQVSLDGEMNIGFRLGLPPFGVIGIPMTITGNAEDFKIKLGKYMEKEMDEPDEEDTNDAEKAASEESTNNSEQTD